MPNFPTSVSTDANLYVAVNGLQTTLASTITDSDTTITLTSTSGFPTTGMVTIDNTEVVAYAGISGANLTGCTRGADGTTNAAHNSGVTVGLTVVAAHHNRLKDEIIAIESALGAGFAKGNISAPGTDGISVSGGTNAVIGSGTSLSQHVADATHNGYLSSTDWSAFSGKQNALTIGNLSAGSSKVSVSGGTGAVIGSGASVDLGSVTLDDLSNVTVPSPSTDDILTWSGSAWVNAAAPAASLPLVGGTMTGDITMGNDKAIVFKETTVNGTDSVTVKAPASVTTSYTLQLPPAVASANQVLTDTAGNGVLSWTTVGATAYREDYIVGTASGNYTGSTTVFDLVTAYNVGAKTMVVALDGDVQTLGASADYLETNSTRVTFNNALVTGQRVSFIFSMPAASSSGIVNSGTAPRLAYYAATGSTVSEIGASASANGQKITNLAAGTAAGDSVRYEQLHYTQTPVFNAVTGQATFSTNSTSYVNVTNVAASITPTSASHKIKVTVMGNLYQNTANKEGFLTISRGSTNVAGSQGLAQSFNSTVASLYTPFCIVYIDSPTTTSSTTYNLQAKTESGGNTNVGDGTNATTLIILEEVI